MTLIDQAAGDLDRAIPLYERSLTDSERVLGARHPLTTMGADESGWLRCACGRGGS
ncbi:hypothetical protein GCM10027589_12110 [Actinocorallia lasiicapitis]